MFPVRSHTEGDYYDFSEMQAMVQAANARPLVLNGQAVKVSWAGPKVSVLLGAARRDIAWGRLARALNGDGVL